MCHTRREGKGVCSKGRMGVPRVGVSMYVCVCVCVCVSENREV